MHGLRELNRNPYSGLFRLDRGSGMLELQRRQLDEVSDVELVRLLAAVAAQRAKRAAKM